MKCIVTIEHDPDLENPAENDCCAWTPYSFSTRHVNYKHPEQLGLSLEVRDGLPVIRNPGLRRKLEVGLAFFLSYYEHGQCSWFLKGDNKPGVEFQWDGTRLAGLLVWEHKPKELSKVFEERVQSAKSFLETYTAWCNGEGYYYCIKDENGNHIDSRGGFYGNDLDYMIDNINSALKEAGCTEIELDGLAEDLSKYHDIKCD